MVSLVRISPFAVAVSLTIVEVASVIIAGSGVKQSLLGIERETWEDHGLKQKRTHHKSWVGF